MSDQWSDPVCFDGDLDVPAACGLPEFSSPLSASTKEYLFTQDWMVSRKAFVRTPLNTPHPSQSQVPDYSAYRLVEEGVRTDVGGGMVKWKRTYAIVPDRHDEFESYSYQFIGFQSFTVNGVVTVVGRNRFSRIVLSRVANDYFLVGAGASYATVGDIPIQYAILQPTRYVANSKANAIVFVPPNNVLTAYPGESDIGFISDFATPEAPFGTTPTRAAYEQWITNARTDGWQSAVVGYGFVVDPDLIVSPYDSRLGTGGQIIAEASRLSRWHGNIYLRQTRYVLAA